MDVVSTIAPWTLVTAATAMASTSAARAGLRERARQLQADPHQAAPAEYLGGRPTLLRWSGLSRIRG